MGSPKFPVSHALLSPSSRKSLVARLCGDGSRCRTAFEAWLALKGAWDCCQVAATPPDSLRDILVSCVQLCDDMMISLRCEELLNHEEDLRVALLPKEERRTATRSGF